MLIIVEITSEQRRSTPLPGGAEGIITRRRIKAVTISVGDVGVSKTRRLISGIPL
jgi:hypothetical protein